MMTKKKKILSIRIQFALIFITLMVGVVLICWLANTLFLEKYYMNEKQKIIYNAYETIQHDAGYQQGIKTAAEMQASVPGLEKILDAVSGVKGIGPKKLEEIKCAIEAAMKEAQD